MVYVMTGGPATGKGTRSKVLAEALGIPHISTGDILREVANDNRKIDNKLEHGKLIPDKVITKLLEERLLREDCKNGFVLDGYPRTLAQVELLDELLEKMDKKVDKVIELTVPDELVYRRILERKKCENCGRIYGLDFPPKNEKICDDCGTELTIRADDTRETVKERIETYKKNSKEILDHYREVGLLVTIDSSNHAENIILQAILEE